MRRFPRFTDVESEQLVDVAVEAIAERCSEDAGYLRFFIRDYLGIAEAAFLPVYERCQQDHSYLTGIARDHVLSLREQAVLDLLHQSMDRNRLIERLGFDPLDPRRRQAYRGATSYLNRHQKRVLIAAFCVSVFMVFVPPQVEERWRTRKGFFSGTNRVELLGSRSIGYGPWRQSRSDVEPTGDNGFSDTLSRLWGGRPVQGHDGEDTVYRWDFRMLAIQFLIVWGLSVLLLVMWRNKKRSYSDYLMQCGASMLPTQPEGNAEPAAPPDNGGITAFPIQGVAGRCDR